MDRGSDDAAGGGGAAAGAGRAREGDPAVLAGEEVDAYWREGWLIPRAQLPADDVARLRGSLDRLLAANPGVRPERLVSAHLEESGKEGVRGSPDFMALARHPVLLGAVEQLIGPDFCLWGCQVFCKPAGGGLAVPMHQDGQYWPIRPLATVTVWVALDRSDHSNGCLRVVPRSHAAKRHFQHARLEDQQLVLNQAIDPSELAALPAAVDVELEPGQFSLHDVYTVHGSDANASDRRRAGVALRYMPTTSVLERHLIKADADAGYVVDWVNRPMFLLKGVDRSGGRNAFTPLPKLAARELGLPSGFKLQEAVVPQADCEALLRWLREDGAIPWEQAVEGRRVAQWGVRYDYAQQAVDLTPVAPAPEMLRRLLPGVGQEFTQCIINDYSAGDGIPWHTDSLQFGPEVLVFCLGECRPLQLRRAGSQGEDMQHAEERSVVSVDIPHGGSYRLTGAARYDWEHCVPPGSGRRISVTFRNLAT